MAHEDQPAAPPLTIAEEAARVGAWVDPAGHVCFGSWMAVRAFYIHAQVALAEAELKAQEGKSHG